MRRSATMASWCMLNISERCFGVLSPGCVTNNDNPCTNNILWFKSILHSKWPRFNQRECYGMKLYRPSWEIYITVMLKALKQCNPRVTLTDLEGNYPIWCISDMSMIAISGLHYLRKQMRRSWFEILREQQKFGENLSASGPLLVLHKYYCWLLYSGLDKYFTGVHGSGD